MYDVQTTKQFDKSFKKCLKRNYHPHKLSGKFEGL